MCATPLPVKDVDGITSVPWPVYSPVTGRGYPPLTAQACLELLGLLWLLSLPAGAPWWWGRSLVIGRGPAAMLLLNRNATVTLCHTRTADLAGRMPSGRAADRRRWKGRDYRCQLPLPGQVVIDVGINVDAAGHLVGDVDFAAAEAVAGAVTPCPRRRGGP